MNKELREIIELETGGTVTLKAEESPPGILEEEIVKMLKENRLIGEEKRKVGFGVLKMSLAFAGSAALVVLGIAIGALFMSPPEKDLAVAPAPEDTSDYILLLRSSASKPAEKSPEIIRQRVGEYSSWARGMAEKGNLLQGEKLKNEMRLLNSGENVYGDQTPLNSNNGVEGFFIIRAKSIDQATEFAKSCPHYKYGGQIEVREFDKS